MTFLSSNININLSRVDLVGEPIVFFKLDEIPVNFFLMFSFTLFFLGILGIVFNRKNLINLMLSVELMLFSASLNFIFFSIYWGICYGYIFALLIITIAAADSAVGLGILIAAFYIKRNITFESFSSLKG